MPRCRLAAASLHLAAVLPSQTAFCSSLLAPVARARRCVGRGLSRARHVSEKSLVTRARLRIFRRALASPTGPGRGVLPYSSLQKIAGAWKPADAVARLAERHTVLVRQPPTPGELRARAVAEVPGCLCPSPNAPTRPGSSVRRRRRPVRPTATLTSAVDSPSERHRAAAPARRHSSWDTGLATQSIQRPAGSQPH